MTTSTNLMPQPWKLVVGAVVVAISACACLLGVLASLFVDFPAPASAATTRGDLPAVMTYAEAQIGQPYLWGGEGPGGFDCSGLVQAAFNSGGVSLPRVAQDQYDHGPHLPAGEEPHLGDLVFFGPSPDAITHVGIALGDGRMINAPHAGATVRIEDYHWKYYVGATRPGAGGDDRPPA
jgi:cell wall-associated NlpC family hydrolase